MEVEKRKDGIVFSEFNNRIHVKTEYVAVKRAEERKMRQCNKISQQQFFPKGKVCYCKVQENHVRCWESDATV